MRSLRILAFSCALTALSLSAHDGAAADELLRLRRENAELREQLLKARTRLRDQELFLAAAADEGEFSSPKAREARMLTKLATLCADGEKLTVKIRELIDEVRAILREAPVDTARRARMNLLLDEVERLAGAFASTLDDPAGDPAAALRECRVLEVNRELGVALVNVGSRQGAFVGLVLHGGPEKSVELRLDEVRSGVSAATLLRGDWRDVIPGMSFSAEKVIRR